MNEIQRLRITDNLMFLLAEKLERMPARTQYVLRLASCLGVFFDLEALVLFCDVLY